MFESCHCFKLELPAIEHHKLWSFQTICWVPGERSLYYPLGYLFINHKSDKTFSPSFVKACICIEIGLIRRLTHQSYGDVPLHLGQNFNVIHDTMDQFINKLGQENNMFSFYFDWFI